MRTNALFPLPLRTIFLVDASASGAMGVLLLLAAGPLAPALGLPAALLRASSAVLVPFALLLVWLSGRTHRALGWAVVVGNVLWTLASVALVLDVVRPTALGAAFVLAQAAAVAAFAALEAVALRAVGRESLGRESLVGAR